METKKYGTIPDYLTTEEVPVGFSFASGNDTGPHTHEFVEIFYIVHGKIEHSIAGAPKTTLQVGDVVIIPSGVVHSFYRDGSTKCGHRDVMIRTSFFSELCQFLDPKIYDEVFKQRTPLFMHVSNAHIEHFESTIKTITRALSTSITDKLPLIKSFIVSLLTPLFSKLIEDYLEEFPAWFNQLLSNFTKIKLIKDGLPAITSDIPYDKKYLCRLFKNNMGMTMTEYLTNIRLEYALNMLKTTDMAILEISQEVGFSSLSHFNKLFKNKYGLQPSLIRKTMTNKTEKNKRYFSHL